MAYTLQQRHNILNGRPLNEARTFLEKSQACIEKLGQDVLDNQYLLSDATLAGWTIQPAQFIEWANRAISKYWEKKMMVMVIDKGNLPADPETATDAQITFACKNSVGAFASRIGQGL